MIGITRICNSFGRDLKGNVHIHLSTTVNGITDDGQQWKKVFFKQEMLMKMWRYQIIDLFRTTYNNNALVLPKALQHSINPSFTFNHFLDQLYQKTWIVHCAKPNDNHKKNVSYLGRYIKRPPIAEAKLKHYDGNEVTFKYLDHKTKTYRRFVLSVEQFIGRFVRHIPDKGFRMIRYYGFLAHRVRGKLLPLVYDLLEQENLAATSNPSYVQLIQREFNHNPLDCILCGQPLLLSACSFGKTSISQLLTVHRQLALLKKI